MTRSRMAFFSATDPQHVLFHAWCIALAVITQVALDIFSTLAKHGGEDNALFQNTPWNVSETFSLEVTMDRWSQIYWVMIDFWSKAWLLEAVVRLLKRNVLGPQCCNPEVHPPVFYLLWSIINVSRMCYLPLWVNHSVQGAVLLRWTSPLLSFYMLHLSYSNLELHKVWLSINNPSVIWWIRYLTQNGLAAFAWWSLLDAVLGFGVVLRYGCGVADPLVSSTVLTVVSVCTITWFLLENFLMTNLLRHTYSVYPVLILGLASMFTRSYQVHDLAANTVYCGFLMLLMTIMNIIHLISACVCRNRSRDLKPADHSLKTVCQSGGGTQAEM